MQRPEVLDRLAKILNQTVANGATEAEAQTAVTLAQRLMDEHNLSSADVAAGGGPAGATIEFQACASRSLGGHYLIAMQTVEQVFSVAAVEHRLLRGKRTAEVRIMLYGDPANVEAGAWGLEFLATTYRRLWDRHRAATGAEPRAMMGYYLGLQDGFLAKTRASRARLELERPGARNTLAVWQGKAAAAAEAANPGMTIKERGYDDGSSYAAGYRDGRDINLARPITEARRGQQAGA